MIYRRIRIFNLISSFLFVFFCFVNTLYGQNNPVDLTLFQKRITFKQDTAVEFKKRNLLTSEPDTNFTWEKYAAFLEKISDTTRYIVLPLNEFRQTFSDKKIVIGLRHDVDNDLNVAYQFSQVESKLGFRSTYFILHTAPYYLANSNNMAVHSDNIIPVLKTMQNDKHLEIGWHNDLVTLQVIYNINPVTFLHNELNWLRSNGLNIVGTAAHGSSYCKIYHYMNFYFFEECSFPVVPDRENNITVPKDGKSITIMKGKLSDFDLQYEAYFLNNNKAFSDAVITNGIRWNIGMLNPDQLQTGDRVIILLHPIHWHRASVHASIQSFSLPGHRSVSIDTVNQKISVEMPYGTDKSSLIAVYTLSPGAYAKVEGKLQVSKNTVNNFNNPLIYKVYAENRDIQKEWTINVTNLKNAACDFLSFTIPGLTKSVLINTFKKSILVEVNKDTDLKHLLVQFDISPGASAWIGQAVQISNSGTIDFSGSVQYRVFAEDGINSCIWTVKVQKVKYLANFVSYSVPGMIGQSKIDTSNNIVNAEISALETIDSLRPSFMLSADSHAWIGKQEQISEGNYRDFSNPVVYEIVSKDSQIIKKWKVTVVEGTLSVKGEKSKQAGLLIYPNPSDGKINLQFNGVKKTPTTLEIYNTTGERVFSEIIKKTGDFTIETDLKKLPVGVYIVKYSEAEKPEIIVIKRH